MQETLENAHQDETAQTVAVVDAYSTGSDYVIAFREKGYRVVHVKSTIGVPVVYEKTALPDGVFAQCYSALDGIESIIDALQRANTVAVLPGAEFGTPLADALAARLGLPGNPPQTSSLRRDKFLMGEAVAAAGLPTAKQALLKSADESAGLIKTWMKWPAVVKPLDSFGGDGVTFCSDAKAAFDAVAGIIDQPNAIGLINTGAILQECLEGTQYIVNTVSASGTHYVTEIWKDNRLSLPGGRRVYDREVLYPFSGETQDELKAYVTKVLDALEVSDGPCHTELMLTKDGPRLIEVGARLQGSILAPAIVAALGDSHVTHSIRRSTDPTEFVRILRDGYGVRRNVTVVSFISQQAGRVTVSRYDELVSSLPSFFGFVKRPAVGDHVQRTVDLWTCPGIVYLLHDSNDQLEEDYQKIRHWEREGALIVTEPK